MAHLPLRPLELTSKDSATYDDWPGELGAQLADPSPDGVADDVNRPDRADA